MRLKVYNDRKEENTVRLKLEDRDDRVTLVAVDKNGNRVECGLILSITSKGLYLHRNVDKDLGLPLVNHGIIKHYKMKE